MSTTKQRLDYLDIAKGIGILLVVFGHLALDSRVQVIIYSFHMPLFLLVNGILWGYRNIENRSVKTILFSNAKHLLIPYIATEVIMDCLFCCKNGYTLYDMKWILWDSALLYYTRGLATWFLLNLFISECIFAVVLKMSKSDVCRVICLTILFLFPLFQCKITIYS